MFPLPGGMVMILVCGLWPVACRQTNDWIWTSGLNSELGPCLIVSCLFVCMCVCVRQEDNVE